ncbi:JAB domain-containing protein [Pedobacter immunditicola]|uniref:JAB domain-containing protein n=1 Tax=Pedobacter immunditicola TaxID=3133440 RepID=UPI0030B78D5A
MVQTTLFKVAEVELKYSADYKIADRPKINSSASAYDILLQQWSLNRIDLLEEFKVLLMNRSNRVLGLVTISQGGVAGTVADPKLIFVSALKAAASSIILAHNHPSGEMRPSNEDIKLTKRIVEGGKLLDIPVMDHLIISRHRFYSFADEGLL